MGGFLNGLFEKKVAAPSQGAAISRAMSQSPSRHGFYSASGHWDIDRAVTDGYEKVMMVFRCVDAIATNQTKIPILHRKGDPRLGELLNNPRIMRLLNVRPNSYETAKEFRYRLTGLALLSRKGYFIEAVPNIKEAESLHLLPPQSVTPVPHPKTFTDGFLVRNDQGVEVHLTNEQVIWGKVKPHVSDPYQQMTPLAAAGLAVETDWLARMFNRNFLMTDGRPGLLITVKGQVNHEDAAEIKRRFTGGYSIAGQTTVIEADGLDVADLASTPRDAQWMEMLAGSKEDIMLAFGVPESVLGNASGRTYDNADAEYEMFWQHTMTPHCDALAGALDVLTGDVTDDTVIAYDYDVIEVLQRHQTVREERIIDRWSRGVTNWNEMRKALNLSESPSLAAQVFFLPSGVAFTMDPADNAEIMKLPIVGQPQQPDALSEVARQGALLGSREAERSRNNQLAARALMLARKSQPDDDVVDGEVLSEVTEGEKTHPFLGDLLQIEAKLEGLLLGLSNRQADVTGDRITHAKVRKGTRHWEGGGPETKALDPFYVVEVERWVNDARDNFEGVLKGILSKEARRVIADMKRNGMDAPTPEVADEVRDTMIKQVLDIVEASVRNQSQRLAVKIMEMDQGGSALDDIKKAIKQQVGTRSSWHKSLSQHVTGAALEGVKAGIYANDPKIKKTWNTENDERVRQSHWWMDGKTLPADGLFYVGETMMRFPHDPLAPIHEVAGCRCWLEWSL